MIGAVQGIGAPRRGARLLVWLIMGLPAGALMVAVLLWGHDYYGLPRIERPFHAYDAFLRPSSLTGLLFGITASILLALNLVYLVRKRLINIHFLGSLLVWMDVHVVTGVVGGAMIAFHAAFAPYSALGLLASVALLITVLTGIVGRYIYLHVPRSLEGRELEFEQVRGQLESCRQQLEEAGVDARWLHEATPELRHTGGGIFNSLVSLAIGDHQRRRDYRQLRRLVRSSKELRPLARKILPLAQSYCRHWQWTVRYHQWRGLLASWRFLHRWLAIVMLIVASFHIFLAFRFGDLPIFGGTP